MTQQHTPSLFSQLIVVGLFYVLVTLAAYQRLFVPPLRAIAKSDAQKHEFSEGRAASHVKTLAGDIGFRIVRDYVGCLMISG